LLFDEFLLPREAVAWCINRIISGRDGVDILCKSEIVKSMVESFLKFTDNPDLVNVKFIVSLLESFV